MLSRLQELHIENQRLSSGEKMLFDDRSLQAIAVSNSVYCRYISHSNLCTLSDFIINRMCECVRQNIVIIACDIL